MDGTGSCMGQCLDLSASLGQKHGPQNGSVVTWNASPHTPSPPPSELYQPSCPVLIWGAKMGCRSSSKVYKPYIFLIDHSQKSLSPGVPSEIPNPKRAVRLGVQPSPRRAPQTGNISKRRARRVWSFAWDSWT